MHKYKDVHLDTKGAEQLDRIISIHKSAPDDAMRVLDQLIAAYPKSAQLWVSKGIFTKTKHIEDRKECFEKAVKVNDGFYDGYRRWATCIRIGTCSFYHSSSSLGRLKFMQSMTQFSLLPTDQHVEFAADHPELLQPNWKERFDASLDITLLGIQLADRTHFTEDEFGEFIDTYNQLRNLPDEIRPYIILIEWAISNS